MGKTINTVTGPISPQELGITLIHEHTFFDGWEFAGRLSYDPILEDEELLAEELGIYYAAGGRALVDVTTVGIGRNPAGLRRLAEATGLKIVMGAGWYRERVYPREVYELSANQLADIVVNEFAHGFDGSDVRPGIIGEIGTERFYITPAEERVFRACARAQGETGATVTTHTTHFGDLALEQVALLTEEGVPPERIVIGHLGEQRGIGRLLEIAHKGVFLGLDHVGWTPRLGAQPETQRARNVVELVRAGHLDQVLISMDICAHSQLHWGGGNGYDYLLREFVPLLHHEGLSESDVHTILVENPRRVLAF
jgi:phosphotriesterase-related protein